MTLAIDQDTCIGCGLCKDICPAVFHLNETIGKSEVMDAEACEFAECCEAAAENCPVQAITYVP
jgi:ferredoxin